MELTTDHQPQGLYNLRLTDERRLFKKRKIIHNNEPLRQRSLVQVDLQVPLVVANIISVFPVYGVTASDPSRLCFRWRSLKVAYNLTVLSTCLLFSILNIYRFTNEKMSYRSFGDLLFYSGTGLVSFKLLRLSTVWKDFILQWVSVQEFMTDLKDLPIRRKINIITILLTISSISEHLLSNSDTILKFCDTKGLDCLQKFLYNRNSHLFNVVSYNLPLGLVAFLFNFIITLGWNFNDIFLTTLSLALGNLFRQFAADLEASSRSVTPMTSTGYWKKRREIYNRLSLLTKLADEKLSDLVVLSFGMNLYYICVQLLMTIKPMESIIYLVYFACSFGHLLCRTCAVCFAASSIYEQSKEPLSLIYSVSSDNFNIEVQRLQTQVSSETLALTGCNFFTVTRTLMLTVAGTIVTYEIVLFQFSSLGTGDDIPLDHVTTSQPNVTLNT